MRRRAGCLVLLAGIACQPQVPAGTDGGSEPFATSSTGTGEATASTTTVAACEAIVAKDWCAVGTEVELCYGDAWQVELVDLVDKLLVGDVDGDGIAGDGRPDVVESIFDGVGAPNPLVVRFGAPP